MTRQSRLQKQGYTVRPDTMRPGSIFLSRNGIHKWFPNISAVVVAELGF